MRTRALGRNGPTVSAVGYGAMLLSIDGRPDEDSALRTLECVLEAGITLLDTADVYSMDGTDLGHNERLIARVLSSRPDLREHVVVATKGGSAHPERTKWHPDGRPEHLRAACEASLRALGVDCIDLYYLHAHDPNVPYEDSFGAVAELQRAGKVRWLGLSNVSVGEIETARRIAPIQAVQNMLNPFVRDALCSRFLRKSVVRHCAKHGLAFVAHSPSGTWWSARLVDHPAVAPVAARHGVSAHTVAQAWVLAQGEHVIPIPGSRRAEHAAQAARAAELTLSREELDAIDRAPFPRD
jgi:aryl-alcohol dehydrogenase-like predicted oxidoreductase